MKPKRLWVDVANCRQVGFLGIAAWVLFWTALFALASFRPSYSHTQNTISELGAVGTPHAAAWNILGFIIPGAIFGLVGAVVARTAITRRSMYRTLAVLVFVIAGLGTVGQGLMAAKMVNGVADVTSISTRHHFISSLISGIAWAVGALMLVGPMKRNPSWRGLYKVNLVLVVLTIATSTALRGALPDGLAQRVGDGVFCAWFVVMSLKLMRVQQTPESITSVHPLGPA